MIYVVCTEYNEFSGEEDFLGYFNNKSDAEEYCKILNDDIDKRKGESYPYYIMCLNEIEKDKIINNNGLINLYW